MKLLKRIKNSSNSLTIYALTLVLLFNHVGNYWAYSCFSKWAIFLISCSVVFSFVVCRKIGLIFFPLLSYVIADGMYTSFYPFNQFMDINSVMFRSGLERDSFYGLVLVMMAAIFLYAFKKSWVKPIENSLIFTWAILTLYTFTQVDRVAFERGAYFAGNASMHACLIAGLLPFVLGKLEQHKTRSLEFQVGVSFMSLWAIIMTDSRMGVGLFCLSVLIYFAESNRRSIKVTAFLLGMLGAVFSFYKYLSPKHMIDTGGRWKKWEEIYSWWYNNSNHWFGWGLGGTFHWSSYIDIATHKPNDQLAIFIWMHNDWLQTLLELGAIGLILSMVSYAVLVKLSSKNPSYLAALVSFGVMGFFNYPLRLPIHAVSFVCLIGLILNQERRYLNG